MTDYEYILERCRQFNNRLWDDKILKECVDKLNVLSDEELCNLFCANEVHADINLSASSDYSFEDIIEHRKRQIELESAIVQAIPTNKIVEIINSFYEDYKRNNDCLVSMDYKTFSQVCKLGKRKLAEIRYQDPFFKKLKDKEIFADEEFVDHGIHGYDNVISIKGCRNFWDEDGKIISAIVFILNACGVVPQFIGWGDEVVFAVASDDYELEYAFEYKQEYMNSRLRDKIDKIFEKEYDKNLVLGCILVEKFIHVVAPMINAQVRCYDKDYLLGRFVIECPNELFTTIDTIADIKNLVPKSKKMDAFIDLINNLVAPPWKDPF